MIEKLRTRHWFFIGIALGLGVTGFVLGNMWCISFMFLLLILIQLNAILEGEVNHV